MIINIKLSEHTKKYLIVGGAVYILELIIILVSQHLLGLSAVIAVSLSFWIGLLVSFALQKFVTFGDNRLSRHILVPQVTAFSLLVLFNFGFTVLVAHILSPPLPAVLARTLSLGITTIWNFYIYKSHIFKSAEELIY